MTKTITEQVDDANESFDLIERENKSTRDKLKAGLAYGISGLGGLGIGLQNFMAFGQLMNQISNGVLALTAGGQAIMHGIAVAIGGVCSGVMNFLINVPLLKGFIDRVSELRFGWKLKGWDKLSNWQKFTYWAGIAIFITSGIMLGLTAFAFGPIGVLAALGIAAGILVALISTVQELETWLERFDKKEDEEEKAVIDDEEVKKVLTAEEILVLEETKAKKLQQEADAAYEASLTLKQKFIRWTETITKGKVIGFILTVGNVIALSLLMAMGVATFLSGVGVAALPALIVGIVIAFTAGAFTEYYFYSGFLDEFCTNFKKKWNEFKNSKWPGLGFACVTTNALVTGVLTYVGITLIAGLIIAAGVAAPPLGIIIAAAAIAAIFAATASFLLGLSFWSKNMLKEEEKVVNVVEEDNSLENEPEDTLTTDASLQRVFDTAKKQDEMLEKESNNHSDEIPEMNADLDLSGKAMEKMAKVASETPDKASHLKSLFAVNDATASGNVLSLNKKSNLVSHSCFNQRNVGLEELPAAIPVCR